MIVSVHYHDLLVKYAISKYGKTTIITLVDNGAWLDDNIMKSYYNNNTYKRKLIIGDSDGNKKK